MKDHARHHAAMLAAIATLTLAGCGYFAPREPDEPGEPPDRHSPTAPESVLFNFEAAFEKKVEGAPQLSEALDADFILELDRRDSDRLNGLMVIFKQEFERANRDFLSLRVQGNDLDLVFRTDLVGPTPFSADSAYYNRLPYSIVIYSPEGSGLEDTLELITGEVFLGMKSRTNWAIGSWTDFDLDGVRTETYGYYMGFYSGLTAPGDILK